ncbi:hypothetical protein ACFX11_007839 [Malus domestica]
MMIREVKDQEEWEKIEQFKMSQDFGKRSEQLDRSKGRKYFWVFVRHPRWRFLDLPWQQWTLVCEVVVEGEKQRLDKWSLMGRLGNLTISLMKSKKMGSSSRGGGGWPYSAARSP